ncbi:hypothetical protein [Anaerotignum sp.]|uniref:hypothetical protein n=1 Tax=Anaerotignum sp. TaxID=2039241 RepID=UPI0027148997|nr:hypothetical protein [Anaerotignum sp.]
MVVNLLVTAVIIIMRVLGNKISNKLDMPILLIFSLLGIIFGSDRIVKIKFDDCIFVEQVCSIALLFIIFFGGVDTKWGEAKPIAVKAI